MKNKNDLSLAKQLSPAAPVAPVDQVAPVDPVAPVDQVGQVNWAAPEGPAGQAGQVNPLSQAGQAGQVGQAPTAFEIMQTVIDTLLGPNGCPWDQAQTPQTLCDNIAEEVFELTDAIRRNNASDICEELGDVLFLILLVAKLNSRAGGADLNKVLKKGAEKMIRRHPHVFSNALVENREQLINNWEQIKREEKAEKANTSGILDSIAPNLPPLLKAYRIHSKAARAGFTWNNEGDLQGQLKSEWQEWQQAVNSANPEQMTHEFGDLLFTLVEFGRRHNLKANTALDFANLRFVSRFKQMEALAQARGLDFIALSLEEKNVLWHEVKQAEQQA